MVTEASHNDVESLRKISIGEVDNLKEYITLLNSIVDNLEQDIVTTRAKAKEFAKSGQNENYGHLMERINETITRIETCRKCIEESKLHLKQKQEQVKEYSLILQTR